MTSRSNSSRVKELTLRGMVAYAVRCAMRVRPLYVGEWAVMVDQQIRSASDFCVGLEPFAFHFPQDACAAAKGAGHAALAAACAAHTATNADYAIANYADTAEFRANYDSYARYKAALHEYPVDCVDPDTQGTSEFPKAGCSSVAAHFTVTTVIAAVDAAAAAIEAARQAGAADEAEAEAHADLEALVRLGHGNLGKVGTQIDPSVDGPLGPLWPEGEPNWYRAT